MRLTVTLISERVNDHTLNAMSAEQNSWRKIYKLQITGCP